MMNFEDVILSEVSQTQKEKQFSIQFHIYKVVKIGRFIGGECGLEVAMGQMREGSREILFHGYRVPVPIKQTNKKQYPRKKASPMDGSDGHIL